MAALATITHLLKADDHVVVCDDVYGGDERTVGLNFFHFFDPRGFKIIIYKQKIIFVGTNRYFSKVSTRFNLEISMVDVTDIEKLKLAIKSNTKVGV